MVKIAIIGADGNMGRLIVNIALKDKDVKIVAGFSIPDSPNIGVDIGVMIGVQPINVKVKSIDDLSQTLLETKPEVIIDFTIAKATEKNALEVIKQKIPLVIGTTGLSKVFLDEMNTVSKEKKIPMVISTNMAIGMNVIFKIAAELAKNLPDWEIEIIEAHHHRKADAPSGTALTIAERIADAIQVNLDDVAKYGRGKGPNPRKYGNKEIGIHAIRAGDIVGDHTVLYAGNGERIELKHQAHSRECFASGAIEAAKFVVKHKVDAKVFNMQEVLFH
jgi:4-hydroxy-tetrahydrodipicolinate reductase